MIRYDMSLYFSIFEQKSNIQMIFLLLLETKYPVNREADRVLRKKDDESSYIPSWKRVNAFTLI